MKSTHRILGHSLLRSLVRSFAPSFARTANSIASHLLASLACSAALTPSWESGFCQRNECVNFIPFLPTVQSTRSNQKAVLGTGKSGKLENDDSDDRSTTHSLAASSSILVTRKSSGSPLSSVFSISIKYLTPT